MHPLVDIATNKSTKTPLTFQLKYWPKHNRYVGRYIDGYIWQHVDRIIVRLSVISKIQLVVYYQCCILIGWATTRLPYFFTYKPISAISWDPESQGLYARLKLPQKKGKTIGYKPRAKLLIVTGHLSKRTSRKT